ncbi:MAG: TetR family transcriptional regulator C-terminal domain-containing protein [Sphingobacteriaceae bacterium]
MATKEKIQNAYMDYVLTHAEQPKSVYIFTRKQKSTEEAFYKHFGSFEGVEQSIWTDLMQKTIAEVQAQQIWIKYSSREKGLSLFYSFFELLKNTRSFAVYSAGQMPKHIGTPKLLQGLKTAFINFTIGILQEGLDSSELTERKFFSDRYKDTLWLQFSFILDFWLRDTSAGFEKTDEAIEKGLNVTFDLFQRSPIDNLLEYGKFLIKNGGFSEKMRF